MPLSIKPGLWFALALALLVLPLPWLGALILSSLIHELGHLAAAVLSGAAIRGLRAGGDGIYLETEAMTPAQGLLCSLAGPLAGLTPLLLARWMPRTAICAAIRSAYHLLPLFPLDGGRALRSLSDYWGWGDGCCRAAERIVVWVLVLGGLFLVWVLGSMVPFLVSFAIIFRVFREKYLANRGRTGYNRCILS